MHVHKNKILTDRDYCISYIRVLATGMVVFIHIIQKLQQYYNNIQWISDWLNLGLVLFFVISAFLYSKKEITKSKFRWFVHRYLDLILPSLFTALLALVMFYIVYKNVGHREIIIGIWSGLGFEAFLSDGWVFIQYWFITYILFCYATVPLIQKIDFKAMKEIWFWSGMILISAILQVIFSTVGLVLDFPTLSWGILLRFYFPYALFKRYDKFSIKKPIKILTLFSALCVVVSCLLRYGYHIEGILSGVFELFFIYTQTIAGTVLFYWLYIFLSKLKENSKLIKYTDAYSYPIYLTHCFFIGYSTSIIDKFENHFIGVFMALICTVLASIFIKLFVIQFSKKIEQIVLSVVFANKH